MVADISAIAANLVHIRERIAAAAARVGRSADEVTLVAVSKTFPAEAIRAAWEAGVRHFGENRVQEWEAKQPALAGLDATWHLVGHLQSNKARRAARLFDCVDSVDSAALAEKLDRAAAEAGRRLRVLLEVRLAPEETKHGAEPDDAPSLAEGVAALPQLDLAGLMAIPPYLAAPEQVRPHFARLRGLRDRIAAQLDRPLPVLSMGMSHDFEVAIAEGATEIRLGTALFGPRG
jgi:pyridoxal phosphate enzyme (YggS family)